MRIDPAAQGVQALLSLACGSALGFLYDLLMAPVRRRLCRIPLLLLFSLLAAALLFLLGSVAGQGQLRLFMLLGAALGGSGYLLLLRPAGLWLSSLLHRILRAVLRGILFPLRLLKILAEKIWKSAKNLFHYAVR